MDKKEFIESCIECGYANRKIATWYAKDKEELTENDFVEIYRLIERAKDVSNDYGKFKNHTTKRYKQSERMGSDRNE